MFMNLYCKLSFIILVLMRAFCFYFSTFHLWLSWVFWPFLGYVNIELWSIVMIITFPNQCFNYLLLGIQCRVIWLFDSSRWWPDKEGTNKQGKSHPVKIFKEKVKTKFGCRIRGCERNWLQKCLHGMMTVTGCCLLMFTLLGYLQVIFYR